MKMVKDTGCRQVTFSKRRTGLFKKANELATLCGAEVAVVVFSPGGKPFSFGQPTVDSVAARFLSRSDPKRRNPARSRKDSAAAERLNQTLNERARLIQEEKKRAQEVNAFRAAFDVDSLPAGELARLKKSLEELRERAKERVVDVEASSTLLLLSNTTPEDHDDDQ